MVDVAVMSSLFLLVGQALDLWVTVVGCVWVAFLYDGHSGGTVQRFALLLNAVSVLFWAPPGEGLAPSFFGPPPVILH